MTSVASILTTAVTLFAVAQTSASSSSVIAGALVPLPEPLRAGATVVRLDANFQPIELRKGTNGMVCIADNANDDRFDVRCYRDSFIQVVSRVPARISGERRESRSVPLPRSDWRVRRIASRRQRAG